MQDGHAVAYGFDLAEFVGREENRFALVFQALNNLTHLHPAQRIKTAGRLIQ